MDELFGTFAAIPLRVTQVARAIIDEADQQRLDPFAAASEDFARAVMEVQVQQLQHVLDFIAAHFARFQALACGDGALALASCGALPPQTQSFEVTAHARIRRIAVRARNDAIPRFFYRWSDDPRKTPEWREKKIAADGLLTA